MKHITVGTLIVSLLMIGCAQTSILEPTEPADVPVTDEPVEQTNEPTEDTPEEEPTSMSEAGSTGTADADVTFVSATQIGPETWSFSVTVAHPDTGWEDYADGWDVVLPNGTVAKPDAESPFTRLLLHPHVEEQPFTRSQSNIVIPQDVTQVTVRAHDIVDGFGGREIVVDLTSSEGEGFTVSMQ